MAEKCDVVDNKDLGRGFLKKALDLCPKELIQGQVSVRYLCRQVDLSAVEIVGKFKMILRRSITFVDLIAISQLKLLVGHLEIEVKDTLRLRLGFEGRVN